MVQLAPDPIVAVQFLCWRKCSTCRNAKAWLLEHGLALEKERDFFAEPFSGAELGDLANLAGGLGKLLSVQSPSFRKLGRSSASLERSQMEELMLREPRLIRRPLLVWQRGLIIGFDKRAYQQMLESI